MSHIVLTCTESDEDVREYEIDYNGIKILVNFNYLKKKDTIYLNKLNIESERANIFGLKFRRIAKEIARQFCIEMKATKIEINGTRRTSGRGKGKIPTSLKFNFGI